MAYFTNAMYTLENLGLRDVILPFLLIFTLIYAVLSKSKVLGEDKKNFNVIVSMVLGLLVVVPHITGSYPAGADVVDIMNSALPNVSLVVVAVIMFLILVGIMGAKPKWVGKSTGGVIAIIAILVVIIIFGNSAGWWTNLPWWLDWLNNSDTQALIVVLIIFGAVIAFVTSDGSKKEGGKDSFLEGLGDMLKGD